MAFKLKFLCYNSLRFSKTFTTPDFCIVYRFGNNVIVQPLNAFNRLWSRFYTEKTKQSYNRRRERILPASALTDIDLPQSSRRCHLVCACMVNISVVVWLTVKISRMKGTKPFKIQQLN